MPDGPRSYSVVARTGGRYVRQWPVGSKYAAKRKRRALAVKYGDTYDLTVEPTHEWADRR